MRLRWLTMLVVPIASFALVAETSDGPDRTQSVPPTAVRSPAQPSSRASDIEQGDRCIVFGATAANVKGEVFDCEPWADGVLRWIYP
jgi:hypothetical protein